MSEIEAKRRLGMALCDKVKQMFARGECDHLSIEDFSLLEKISSTKRYYTPYEAQRYLNVSQSRFYMLRKAGLIGEPIKVSLFNKLVYEKSVLDEAKERLSSMSERDIKISIILAKAKEADNKYDEE